MQSFIDRGNMSAAAVANRLVAIEEQHTRSRMLAYERLASKLGKSVTWLRTLIRGGVSRVDTDIMGKLDAMLVRSLEVEIGRLQADLEMARRCGAHPMSSRIGDIEKHLTAARELMCST